MQLLPHGCAQAGQEFLQPEPMPHLQSSESSQYQLARKKSASEILLQQLLNICQSFVVSTKSMH